MSDTTTGVRVPENTVSFAAVEAAQQAAAAQAIETTPEVIGTPQEVTEAPEKATTLPTVMHEAPDDTHTL